MTTPVNLPSVSSTTNNANLSPEMAVAKEHVITYKGRSYKVETSVTLNDTDLAKVTKLATNILNRHVKALEEEGITDLSKLHITDKTLEAATGSRTAHNSSFTVANLTRDAVDRVDLKEIREIFYGRTQFLSEPRITRSQSFSAKPIDPHLSTLKKRRSLSTNTRSSNAAISEISNKPGSITFQKVVGPPIRYPELTQQELDAIEQGNPPHLEKDESREELQIDIDELELRKSELEKEESPQDLFQDLAAKIDSITFDHFEEDGEWELEKSQHNKIESDSTDFEVDFSELEEQPPPLTDKDKDPFVEFLNQSVTDEDFTKLFEKKIENNSLKEFENQSIKKNAVDEFDAVKSTPTTGDGIGEEIFEFSPMEFEEQPNNETVLTTDGGTHIKSEEPASSNSLLGNVKNSEAKETEKATLQKTSEVSTGFFSRVSNMWYNLIET